MTWQNLATCYSRAYSDAHLASHPQQKVGALALVFSDYQAGPPIKVYDLRLRLKDEEETWDGAAYCERSGAVWSCGMEADAGGFVIESRDGGAILIRISQRGVSFEREDGFLTLSGTSGDDREFLLRPDCG
jgi:hypothetical protein